LKVAAPAAEPWEGVAVSALGAGGNSKAWGHLVSRCSAAPRAASLPSLTIGLRNIAIIAAWTGWW